MSDTPPIRSDVPPRSGPPHAGVARVEAARAGVARAGATTGWRVRQACHDDLPAIATAVEELLLELGGTPAASAALRDAARTIVEDERAGALIVAEADGQLVGLLGVSWQLAVRIPGRYGLIQELWVHPDWRGRAVGGELLEALIELAREWDVARIEVGLPSERFAGLEATQAFYMSNGFSPIGPRMRRLV